MTAEPRLLLPVTGELVLLTDPAQVAGALSSVRRIGQDLRGLRQLLEAVLRLEARRQGTKTLHLTGGLTATVSGGTKPEWDVERLREGLEQAGLPPGRMAELIVETVSYDVKANVAKQLAAANDAYALVIREARSDVEAPWYVRVT